ncbi:hypothetical protein [Streptomyces heilongjiangensis]|uniref:Uncharacterized protein n=1 Tax=Streptomyces heilongjiangensis TaxID=945052 RepID=A0ABW1AYQ8_9ACTN|nr:hypothetical protein [Streptomyces heilongjiangensis]MDC2947951.1 hypothetical protein [Streptomyces heilongjiangensis]
MAAESDHPMPQRGVRQLRRIRAFYAVAASGWAVLAAWEGWVHPGSRPMWLSVLFLAVFTGLLTMTTRWLQGQDQDRAGVREVRTTPPARHAGGAPWFVTTATGRAGER